MNTPNTILETVSTLNPLENFTMSIFYRIKNLFPATNYWVVFRQEIDKADPTKGYELWAEPFEFLAIADEIDTSDSSREVYSTIAAVQLCGGRFEICNEADNFCGIVEAGFTAKAVAEFVRRKDAVRVTTPNSTAEREGSELREVVF